MDKDTKVIVIESLLRSRTFLRYLKKLINSTLYENNISISSIKRDGFYFIIQLSKINEIVFAMDLLCKIAGINIIFIAKPMTIDYDLISQSAFHIGKELLLPNEKFAVSVTTSKKIMLKDDKILFFKKDMEFLIASELSSLPTGNKYVKNESEADKILLILIGNDFAYISLLLKKGTDTIPFNYLNEKVVCPIYGEEYSFLSLISLLNNGFFPSPFIFYSNRSQLLKILKLFDTIIKRYPISVIDINLIDISDTHLKISKTFEKGKKYDDNSYPIKKILLKLIMEEVIFIILLKLDANSNSSFICLPFVSYVHPLWFIKKNIIMSFDSGKIPLTPLIYNFEYKNILEYFNSLNKSFIIEQSLESDDSFFSLKKENFEAVIEKLITMIKISANKITKNRLDLRKDDVLDVLDSI